MCTSKLEIWIINHSPPFGFARVRTSPVQINKVYCMCSYITRTRALLHECNICTVYVVTACLHSLQKSQLNYTAGPYEYMAIDNRHMQYVFEVHCIHCLLVRLLSLSPSSSPSPSPFSPSSLLPSPLVCVVYHLHPPPSTHTLLLPLFISSALHNQKAHSFSQSTTSSCPDLCLWHNPSSSDPSHEPIRRPLQALSQWHALSEPQLARAQHA